MKELKQRCEESLCINLVVGGQHAAVEDCNCTAAGGWRTSVPAYLMTTRCHGVLQGKAEDDIVKLPTEILPLIFFYLPYSDLLSVRVTHKNW